MDITTITIFILAVFVGFEIITKVPPTLHTPLMSGSNAISGIAIIGAIISVAKKVAKVEGLFQLYKNTYIINSSVRRNVLFTRHDLLSDPPYTKIDLISCRNLLIYLKTYKLFACLTLIANNITCIFLLYASN